MSKKGTSIAVLVAVLIVAGVLIYAQKAPSQDGAPRVEDGAMGSTTTTNQEENTNMEPQTTTTASGLAITVLTEGTGEPAAKGDTVSVNYTGMLENGTAFDSNVDPRFGHVEPFSFTLGQNRVIQGWEQGVLGMKVGEQRKLVIPAVLGYGEYGAGSAIPPNATLIFTVEVTGIAKAK